VSSPKKVFFPQYTLTSAINTLKLFRILSTILAKFPWKRFVEEEGRFMEEFAYSVGQEYDPTNGLSPHGGTTWSNRMAIVL